MMGLGHTAEVGTAFEGTLLLGGAALGATAGGVTSPAAPFLAAGAVVTTLFGGYEAYEVTESFSAAFR